MTSTRTAVLWALAAFVVSGCGTVANLQTGKPDFYGGVQHDVQLLETPRSQPQGIGIRNLGALVLFVDLPLSIVGDTLTLPLAIYEWHREDGHTAPVGGGSHGTTAPAVFHSDNPP
jgi:uncharacterized protein YceK